MTFLHRDVLVAGGGPAGVAAAVAAARAGASVLLAERQGVLGGSAAAGRVGTVCGLYLRGGGAPRFAAGGFAREFAERLARESGTAPFGLRDGLWVLPYEPRVFQRLCDDLVAEAGAELALHATLAGVRTEGGRIVAARVLAWGDELAVEPRAVVDATGEATAAALAGAPTEQGLDEQAAALVFHLEGVDPDAAGRGTLPVLLGLTRGVRDGLLPPGCDRVAPVPGTGGSGALTLKLGLPAAVAGSPEPAWRQVTAWEREGRARIDAIERFLADRVAGFERARVGQVAPQVGVRSGRRVRGRATLADADVLRCARHPDGVARGCWPMERWGDGPRPSLAWLPEGASYEIPLGCLRPQELENVFAAGRCLSAEPGAAASARVVGTALATGWAAGTLAACRAANVPLEAAAGNLREQWGPGGEDG